MPVPAVPGPGLVVSQPQLRLGRLEGVASRPEEFHPRPLTERCGSLSAHTAPTKQPTASLPPRSPPVASWTLTTTAWPNPFAPAALPAFIARTGWSVPVLRIGTLASWWSPLGLLPWHRSDRFPQFHMRARIRLAPPLRRSPSAPYPGVRRTDPRGSRSLWFRRQVSGSRRFNRGSVVFAFLIPTCPRWTSDFDTNAHHRRLFTAAAWRGLEPAPGSGLRRAFLHLSCSLCTIGQFIANLPFLRLRRTLDGTSIRAHHKAAGAEKRGPTARGAMSVRRWAARVAATAPRRA